MAPTVLDAFGIPTPAGMDRNRVISVNQEPKGKQNEAYTEEEEAELAQTVGGSRDTYKLGRWVRWALEILP